MSGSKFKKLSIAMNTFLVFVVLSTLGISLQETLKKESESKSKAGSPKARRNAISFKNDVFPLIKKNCLPCHSEEQMNPSELYMDSYDGIMAGGKHGKPIVPGKAKESLMIQKFVEIPPFGDRMPLKAKEPLSTEEMKILIDWINQGAKKN